MLIRYVVTKIHRNLTPNSPFPNSSYASYAAYIKEKYGQTVVNDSQFLIETKGITNNLKRLTPGEGVSGSRNVTYRGPELLIPEFCYNYQFPADLWLKATLLPSILHRLYYILVAEKMRTKINRTIGIANDNYTPQSVIEKMKLTPILMDGDNMHVNKMPCLPNSIFLEPKHIEKKDFISLSETSVWNPTDEPIDFERHTSEIFPIELDYFYNFISEKIKKIKLSDDKDDQQAQMVRSTYRTSKRTPFPINDVSDTELMHINILDIQRDSMVVGPEQCDLLAAITVASSADVFNMERLEVLGDSYLKFAVSLFLIQQHPTWHEGFLTACKGKIVSNRNLLYQGIERNIGGMLNVNGFEPKGNWTPPLFSVPREAIVSLLYYFILFLF